MHLLPPFALACTRGRLLCTLPRALLLTHALRRWRTSGRLREDNADAFAQRCPLRPPSHRAGEELRTRPLSPTAVARPRSHHASWKAKGEVGEDTHVKQDKEEKRSNKAPLHHHANAVAAPRTAGAPRSCCKTAEGAALRRPRLHSWSDRPSPPSLTAARPCHKHATPAAMEDGSRRLRRPVVGLALRFVTRWHCGAAMGEGGVWRVLQVGGRLRYRHCEMKREHTRGGRRKWKRKRREAG